MSASVRSGYPIRLAAGGLGMRCCRYPRNLREVLSERNGQDEKGKEVAVTVIDVESFLRKAQPPQD